MSDSVVFDIRCPICKTPCKEKSIHHGEFILVSASSEPPYAKKCHRCKTELIITSKKDDLGLSYKYKMKPGQ
jgi:hypothetical protein